MRNCEGVLKGWLRWEGEEGSGVGEGRGEGGRGEWEGKRFGVEGWEMMQTENYGDWGTWN